MVAAHGLYKERTQVDPAVQIKKLEKLATKQKKELEEAWAVAPTLKKKSKP
jgi:hypothetical protein